ncbi:unnamed protein product [Moneuplotes crassus]|uniref:C2H2-type domain-containing protein n=1 Tax=Euplotes crassus TaxID=5936 RepID=A0AAD2D0J3_EUPCR|nr:unnamed protein product [Moneuplotes crassus]
MSETSDLEEKVNKIVQEVEAEERSRSLSRPLELPVNFMKINGIILPILCAPSSVHQKERWTISQSTDIVPNLFVFGSEIEKSTGETVSDWEMQTIDHKDDYEVLRKNPAIKKNLASPIIHPQSLSTPIRSPSPPNLYYQIPSPHSNPTCSSKLPPSNKSGSPEVPIKNFPHKILYLGAEDSKLRRKRVIKCGYKGCDKVFDRSWNFRDHARMHLGIQPYKCPVCRSTFTQKGNCLRHIRTHHSKLISSRSKSTTYQNNTFQSSSSPARITE